MGPENERRLGSFPDELFPKENGFLRQEIPPEVVEEGKSLSEAEENTAKVKSATESEAPEIRQLSLGERLERLEGIEGLPLKDWLEKLASFYPALISPLVVKRHINLAAEIDMIREKERRRITGGLIIFGGGVLAPGAALGLPGLPEHLVFQFWVFQTLMMGGAFAHFGSLYWNVRRPLERLKKDWHHFPQDPLSGYIINYELRQENQEIAELKTELGRVFPGSLHSQVFNRIFNRRRSKTQEEGVLEGVRPSVVPADRIVAEYQRTLTQVMKDLEENGVLDDHHLERIEREAGNPDNIKFSWVSETDNYGRRIIDSELPKNKFQVIKKDEVERPTVRFLVNPLALMRMQQPLFSRVRIKPVSFPYPEDYLRPDLVERVEVLVGGEDSDEVWR